MVSHYRVHSSEFPKFTGAVLAHRQACICLSNHLIAQPSILEEALDVLELGAGVGLLSLVAGCLAPSCRITASDVDDRVLEQLARNVELSEHQYGGKFNTELTVDPTR